MTIKDYIEKMNRDAETIRRITKELEKEMVEIENKRLIRNAERIINKGVL